ncbi:DUF4376 domain-containing protein [Epibacterium sp. MM17-32]|uniref:DUF4376 domain-containing protein n=1 Tax=Epibacterium sp. MM17-32 TaxID=2917734 RepID=UPI001EF4B5CF|nr:DUF4376 domain-containing protein [Epibacterium sp. MM17-32]MCG7630535.1 DUF4376 domain-containing protein [Epibacterium sp. MM17-32]
MSTIDFSQVITAQDRTEAARVQALANLADLRWKRTLAGVTLPGGLHMPGDETTRLALSGAVSALDQGMIAAPVAWKTPAGFVELTQSQIDAAAAAVVQHVQACFAAEARVAVQIAASADPAGLDVQAAFDAACAG